MSSVSKMASGNKRGRAYQCLRCLHRTGKEMVDARYRVENHILKTHLSLDEVPHYCTLCLFRCQKRADLEDHVRSYRRHAVLTSEKGIIDHTACLVSNTSPYILGDRDILTLTQEESALHWASRTKKGDCLAEAVDQVFPEGLMAELETTPSSTPSLQSSSQEVSLQDQARQALTMSSPSVHAPLHQTPQAMSQGMLAEVSRLVGGTVLQTLLGLNGPQEEKATTGHLRSYPQPAESQPKEVQPAPIQPINNQPLESCPATPARSVTSKNWELDSPREATPACMETHTRRSGLPTPAREESIMQDLLPAEDKNIFGQTPTTIKRTSETEAPAAKKLKKSDPDSPFTIQNGVLEAIGRLQAEVVRSTNTISKEMEKNTRAVRCVERAIVDMSRISERMLGVLEREDRRKEREEREKTRSHQTHSPRRPEATKNSLRSVVRNIKKK